MERGGKEGGGGGESEAEKEKEGHEEAEEVKDKVRGEAWGMRMEWKGRRSDGEMVWEWKGKKRRKGEMKKKKGGKDIISWVKLSVGNLLVPETFIFRWWT